MKSLASVSLQESRVPTGLSLLRHTESANCASDVPPVNPIVFRCRLVELVGWVLAPILQLGVFFPAVGAEDRPNILWISCEDISPHLGCYGDEHAATPILDSFAEQGTRYTRAFVTAGVCAPSRSAIITGMYATTLGTHHMRCRAKLPSHIRPFPEYLRQTGYYCTNNSKTDYQLDDQSQQVWHASSKTAHWRNREDHEQPFFAVFNFVGCHESGIARDEKFQQVTRDLPASHRHDAQLLELPPYYPDTPRVREDWKRYYDLVSALDHWVGKLLHELEEDELADSTIVFFWSDHGVGLPRAKRWLYDSGIHVPLIVRVPEQYQAKGGGPPGSVCGDLISLIDLAPTVLRLAQLDVPDYMQGQPFLGEESTNKRTYVYAARDRMDERYDVIRAVRDRRFKYLRNYEPQRAYYQYMNTPEQGATMREIRRVHALGELPPAAEYWMASEKPVEELYDLQADPHEICNLAQDPEWRDVLLRLRNAHLDWVQETGDLGLIPEPELVARERALGSRFEILRVADPSLSQRLRAAAELATDPDTEFVQLQALLQDHDAAIRWWGATGIGNLAQPSSALIEALRLQLNDSSPAVRVAVARALCQLDQFSLAQAELESALRDGQQWVRLQAAIVLDEIGEPARASLASLRSALEDRENKYVVRVANHAVNRLLGTQHRVP